MYLDLYIKIVQYQSFDARKVGQTLISTHIVCVPMLLRHLPSVLLLIMTLLHTFIYIVQQILYFCNSVHDCMSCLTLLYMCLVPYDPPVAYPYAKRN